MGLFIRPLEERLAGTIGPALEAGPHGTRFDRPVALRFSPQPEDLAPGIHFGELKVATLENGRWQLLPTSFPAPGVIEGLTTHFSTFALLAPCHASGFAHDFPLNGCPTFDPRILTSADVNLEVRAFPVTLMLNLRPTPGAGVVDFTVSGLRAGWTYYLSRDGGPQLDSVVADAAGVARFAQDASTAHALLLMARHGSITLSPTTCTTIGVWESSTRTCRLTQDYLTPPIFLGDDGLKLDCAGHLIGGPTRSSLGVAVLHNEQAIRNCEITNVDVGIGVIGDRLTVEDVSIATPAAANRGGEAIILTDATDAVFTRLTVTDFLYGLSASGGSNLLMQGASFRVSEFPIAIGEMNAVTLNDVVVDGALFDDLELPVGAIQLSLSHGVSINRLSTRGAMTGVTNVVVAQFDSDVIIADSVISQGNAAIRLDGPGVSSVFGSTLSQNAQALQLNGGTNYIFHNNLLANGTPSVVSTAAVDLFDNRPGSATYQQGNFWGRACPDTLFVAGVDSNLATVVDLFPYGVASAWASGGAPGCTQPPTLAAPILTAPGGGSLLNTGAVLFEGSAVPGATVEILEGAVVRATALAASSGLFSMQASPPLADGSHSVTARATLSGRVSAASAALAFTVDTVAPSAPLVVFPSNGASLVESSPFVLGTAEALSRVVIEVDGVGLANGNATAAGEFQFRLVGLSAGAHELRARAIDAAGNTSLTSAPVAVTVLGTNQRPLGSAGRLLLSAVTDAPDAFEALAGESNFVTVRGQFSAAAGGANARYELVLTRTVRRDSSSTPVASVVARSPVSTPQGNVPGVVQGTVGWNGRNAAGQLLPPGAYVSSTRADVVRTTGGSQGCLSVGPTGCVVDTLELVTSAELASAPLLARPPVIPEASGLVRRSVDFATPGARVLVVPETAFLAAIAMGRGDVASVPAKQAAVTLAGATADPLTLGVVAELQISNVATSFSGEVFIVARSAVSAKPGSVESTNFYTAAVKLTGEAPWVGTLAVLGTASLGTLASGNCCSPQPVCTSTAPLPGPCGTKGYCAPPDVLTTEGSSSGSGNTLAIYGYAQPGTSQPVAEFSCPGSVFPGCTQAQPYCDPSRSGPVGPGNGGSFSDNGGCTSQDFGNGWLAPRCTVALTTGDVPEGCLGYCTSCGQLASSWWTMDGVHPSCAYAMPGPGAAGGLCQPRTAAEATMANMRAFNTVQNSNCRGAAAGLEPNANCCGANCVCTPGTTAPTSTGWGAPALQTCTKCDANDSCQVFHQATPGVSLIATGFRAVVFAPVTLVGNPTPPAPVPGATPPATSSPAEPSHQAPPGVPPTPAPPQAPPPTGGGSGGAPGGNTGGGPGGNTGGGPGGSTGGGAGNQDEPLPRNPGFSGEGPAKPADVVHSPETTATHHDPIHIGDGSLEIRQVDLSMPGAPRSLEFERFYDSQSNDRSTLGSNWTHNWDVRLQVVREGNRPSWIPLYCASTPAQDMCVIVYDPRRGTQLFALDYRTGLYMPQAGSTDTVARTKDGAWALRTKHGDVLAFNEEGYLVSDRDRFGNGFTVQYEDTPLGALYRHGCNTPWTQPGTGAPPPVLPTTRCPLLAGVLNEAGMPDYPSPHWSVGAGAFPISPTLPATEFTKAVYGRDYFLHLLSRRTDIHSPFGARRMRPVRVTDDQERQLVLTYYSAPPQGQTWDFASTPEADLLKEVQGPSGVRITFQYQRPTGYPAELSEMFLTQVSRSDSPTDATVVAAPARTQSFSYQWPNGPTPDWSEFAASVEQSHLSYFTTFVGCWYRSIISCGSRSAESSQFIRAPGDPTRLARLSKNAFIGRVADNIIKVTNAGLIESETRYDSNPFSRSFDNAIAQRYGSRERRQDSSRLPADLPAAGWEEPTLPRAMFAYASAGPSTAGTDATDAFLPAAIRSHYALEPMPNTPNSPGMGGPALGSGAPVQSGIMCDGNATEQRRRLLPGYQDEVPFFYAPPTDLTGSLKRTPLSCSQLAIAQTSNAAHNDLLSSLVPAAPIPGVTGNLYQATPVLDWRRGIAANVNRICSWTRSVDRDGDTRYYGLNYRGQVLVDAVEDRQVAGEFIFTESLYTADGQLQQSRRPTRGANTWSPAKGHTVYQYDELDPRGNFGWNAWQAAWWTRRTNLIAVDEFPATGQVLDVGEASGSAVTTSQARFQRMRYEPLFNQLMVQESGSLSNRVPTTHRRTEAVFDYQELNRASAEPLLKHLESWGFRWLRDSSGAYDFGIIQSWQVQLPFLGRDLNGDTVIGTQASVPARRGVGLPILTTRRRDQTSSDQVVIARAWTGNGQPAGISSSEGQSVVFEYYKPADLGSSSPPTAATASSGNHGFLAKVSSARFDDRYPSTQGPTGVNVCAALKGPYQWLLPSSCSNVTAELIALGLPQEAVDAVLESTNTASSARAETVSFSYNATGRPNRERRETGTIRRVLDTDGRPSAFTDLLKTVTKNEYNARAQRISTTRFDENGALIDAVYVVPDDEGLTLCECRELTAGACRATCNHEIPPPDTAVTRFSYTPEGDVRLLVDPERLATELTYNERKLPVRQVRSKGLELREDNWRYTVDGDVEVARYGVSAVNTLGLQSERFSYDGLRRLSGYTDKRGVVWQLGHSSRDLLSLALRSDTALAALLPLPQADWKARFEYDGFERLSKRVDNDVIETSIRRSLGGNAFALTRTGEGTTFVTYDLAGKPVWRRDAAGSDSVFTWRPQPHQSTLTTIRRGVGGTRLTTAVVQTLNPAGQPTSLIEVGGAARRETTIRRDGEGDVVATVNPELLTTKQPRNLAGWPLSVEQQRSRVDATLVESSSYAYDRLGRVTQVTDPNSLITTLSYTAFGEVKTRRVPGTTPVAFTYDDVGRLDTRTTAGGTIRYDYDARGDQVGEVLLGGNAQNLMTRTFDVLGRLQTATNFNVGLPTSLGSQRQVRTRLEYDSAGRLKVDGQRLGTSIERTVTSHWSLDANALWQRDFTVSGAQGAQWRESFDAVGRLATKQRRSGGTAVSSTTFDWLGELPAGRSQSQRQPSPFRQKLTFDSFGAPLEWAYTAIDLNGTSPANTAEGNAYCGGSWDASTCGQPLLQVDVLRDLVGRVASLQWQYANPVSTTAAARASPWRGYTYSALARLEKSFEDEGVTRRVSTAGLSTHTITEAQVAALGANGAEWDFDREPLVGSTTAVREASTGTARWKTTQARESYQLRGVEVDGQSRAIAHDDDGRLIQDGNRTYDFDVRGQLAVVRSSGVVLEALAYDGLGRAAAQYNGSTSSLTSVFQHDGRQMVQAVSDTGAVQWEAAWGPGIDSLLEWVDVAGGTGRQLALLDSRNSVAAYWSDQTGELSHTAEYNAEGRVLLRAPDGSVGCAEVGSGTTCPLPASGPFGFSAAWRSSVTGLVSMRARWYSPQLGEFLSQDGAGYLDSFNLYGYVGFDPINRRDWSGKEWESLDPAGGESAARGLRPLTDFIGRQLQQAYDYWAGGSERPLTAEEATQVKAAIGAVAEVDPERGAQLAEMLEDGKIRFDPEVAKDANALTPPQRTKIVLGTMVPPEGRGLDATLVHELGHFNSNALEFALDREEDLSVPELVNGYYAEPAVSEEVVEKLKKRLDGARAWRDEWDYLRRRQNLPNPLPPKKPFLPPEPPGKKQLVPGGVRHQARVTCSPKSLGCK